MICVCAAVVKNSKGVMAVKRFPVLEIETNYVILEPFMSVLHG